MKSMWFRSPTRTNKLAFGPRGVAKSLWWHLHPSTNKFWLPWNIFCYTFYEQISDLCLRLEPISWCFVRDVSKKVCSWIPMPRSPFFCARVPLSVAIWMRNATSASPSQNQNLVFCPRGLQKSLGLRLGPEQAQHPIGPPSSKHRLKHRQRV